MGVIMNQPSSNRGQILNPSSIIIFDGVCNLCNNFINFVIDRDPQINFKFVANQSEIGQQLIQKFQLPNTLDTIVLIESDRYYTHSTAVLRIFRRLPGIWAGLSYFLIMPRPLRDWAYTWVARYRYRWLGQSESCRMPTPELQRRFLN
jgi:predicted DCC family thiol-disulfide oxidoreductase YuxK